MTIYHFGVGALVFLLFSSSPTPQPKKVDLAPLIGTYVRGPTLAGMLKIKESKKTEIDIALGYECEGSQGNTTANYDLFKEGFRIDLLEPGLLILGRKGDADDESKLPPRQQIEMKWKPESKKVERIEIEFKNDANAELCFHDNPVIDTNGVFQRTPEDCATPRIRKIRAEAASTLKNGKTSAALQKLRAADEKCRDFLPKVELAWVYSDISLAAHRNHDDKACLEFVEKGLALAMEGKLESGSTIVKALNTNHKLCPATPSPQK